MYKTFLGFLVFMLVVGMTQDKNPPRDLVQYIRDARKAGLQDNQIQQNAVKAGWPVALVSEAIAAPPRDAKEPPEEKQPSKESPKAMSETAATSPTNAAAWDP